MRWEKVSDEFTIDDIGARLLANLARGIYNHEAVLREYVQNARDAYLDLSDMPENPTINIRIINNTTITIQDNGIGMDEEAIKASKKIAVSPKAGQEGRVGFRGIGIWAGFQACDKIEIETTKKGDSSRYKLYINFSDILQHVNEDINIKDLLDSRFQIQRTLAPPDEHFTLVKLVSLQGDYRRLTDHEELRRIASQILPGKIDPQFEYAEAVNDFLHGLDGYQEFSILVEGREIFRQFPSGLQGPQFVPLKRNGEEYARAWYCTGDRSITPKEYQYRNFRLRTHNFAVGRVGIFDDEDGDGFGIVNKVKLGSATHLNWHVGEIHITHPDIMPDTPRSSLELDAFSRGAIEEIRSFYEDRITDSRARSSLNTFRKQIEDCETILNNTEDLGESQAAGLLSQLREQESKLRGRRPNDKVKQRLRELLAKPEISTKRKNLIRRLERILKATSGASPTPSSPSLTQPPPSQPQPVAVPPRIPVEAGKVEERVDPMNYEQLLSDVFEAIREKVGDDVELSAEICEAVHKVFEKYGLINA